MNTSPRRGRWAAILLLAGLCAACAGPEPKVIYKPYPVKEPVPVPCAAEIPKEPEWATKGLRKADTLDDKTKALLAEREQRIGYEEKLKKATDGCR
jgi:hypothetical protein